ncbi:MAG: ERCC4 domain-containing protein [Planctomycetota bacterium]
MPLTGFNKEETVLVVDTREQLPFEFRDSGIHVVHQALPAGDYSILGYEDQVAVERKTLDDFASTVIRSRERFHRELKRFQEYKAACIVVEGSMGDLLQRKYKSYAHPQSIFGAMISIIVDYGIPVFFCTNRQVARVFTEKYLLRFKRKATS